MVTADPTSTSFTRPVTESHACAHRARDQSALRVGHVALRQPDRPAGLHHARGGGEYAGAERPQEVDLELERGEGFALAEGRGVGDAHRRVGDVAEDATVKGAHRIRVLRARVELED